MIGVCEKCGKTDGLCEWDTDEYSGHLCQECTMRLHKLIVEENRCMGCEAKDKEIKRILDAIYSLSKTPQEQARRVDPVQWIKTRLVHIERYNEEMTRLMARIEKAEADAMRMQSTMEGMK